MGDGNNRSSNNNEKPEWLQQYNLIGKIGEGTYGLVFLAKTKSPANRGKSIAIKKFKQSKDGDGVSPTAIREIMLLREITHENVVKLVNVHINHTDMSLYLAFDYAEHDLYEIIRHHRDKGNNLINQYTVKSLLWQLLNGLNYLHSNWIIHRDLKPSNILVMGEGEEHGVVKIADFGLARIYQAPLKTLFDNGVVVTIWYRAPELLLGAKHYTSAIDMWAVGCIFAELLTLKPLFQGAEAKSTSNPFQLDQLDKIFKVLGHPTLEKWPTLASLPHWQNDVHRIQEHKYENTGLHSVVPLSPKGAPFDLLSKMLEYDPQKRITAAQALEHDYFRSEPLPGRNALVPSQPGEKVINYPTRPVDTNTDFEGTTSLQPPQPVSSGNAVSGGIPGAHGVNNRSAPLNRANPTTSMKWRTQIRHNQLVFQISSILLQRHNWVSLLQNFNLSTKLTPPLFNQILHKTQTNPQISLRFFNWVQTNLKLKPDLKSQCHIIYICVNSGLTLPVRPIMDSLVKTHHVSVLGEAMVDSCRGKSLKSDAFSFVLECYSHKGLFMESLEMFRKMRGNGFIASGTACNAILDVLLRENEIKLAWCFYCAMIKDGVLPDKLTWSLIAQILCKDGNFERIVKFLDMGVYNSVLYNGVIDCCSKRGDFEAAFERLNQMCERKLDPGFSTYSAILDGACKHGNEEVIERVMDIMAEKGLLPKCPLSQCDSVIQKFSDLCKMNVATMFFRRACDEKIRLQDATYGCMLKALSKEARVKEAIGLYSLISEKGIRVKDSTYHAFLDLLSEEDQYEEGYEILGDMMRRGFRPGTVGLSKFILLLSRKRRWREVEDLLDLVLEKGLLPDSLCCCSLVEHYCSRRQIDKAVALHNKMEKLQASLDVATYNILLDGLVKNGRIEEVVRVFDYMEGLKLVNSESFTITIRGLCRAKEMRKAMKLHDEMLDMGLKPDKAAYKRLILEFNK